MSVSEHWFSINSQEFISWLHAALLHTEQQELISKYFISIVNVLVLRFPTFSAGSIPSDALCISTPHFVFRSTKVMPGPPPSCWGVVGSLTVYRQILPFVRQNLIEAKSCDCDWSCSFTLHDSFFFSHFSVFFCWFAERIKPRHEWAAVNVRLCLQRPPWPGLRQVVGFWWYQWSSNNRTITFKKLRAKPKRKEKSILFTGLN